MPAGGREPDRPRGQYHNLRTFCVEKQRFSTHFRLPTPMEAGFIEVSGFVKPGFRGDKLWRTCKSLKILPRPNYSPTHLSPYVNTMA